MGTCASLDGSGNPYDRGVVLVNSVLSQEWEKVKVMLQDPKAKINVDVKENELGGTALIWASALKHEETVRLLLEKNANTALQTHDGRTCLFTAAIADMPGIVRRLMAAKCDPEVTNPHGCTALHAACQYNSASAVGVLIELGAELEAATVNCRSPLHCACEEGALQVVHLLLHANAEVNAENRGGGTPLHLAALGCHVPTIEALIQKGANINAQSCKGMTALHTAAFAGATAVVKILIAEKADVAKQNQLGRTALHIACGTDKASTVSTILALTQKGGASWQSRDKSNRLPLSYADEKLLDILWEKHNIEEAQMQILDMNQSPRKSPVSPRIMIETEDGGDDAIEKSPKTPSKSPSARVRKLRFQAKVAATKQKQQGAGGGAGAKQDASYAMVRPHPFSKGNQVAVFASQQQNARENAAEFAAQLLMQHGPNGGGSFAMVRPVARPHASARITPMVSTASMQRESQSTLQVGESFTPRRRQRGSFAMVRKTDMVRRRESNETDGALGVMSEHFDEEEREPSAGKHVEFSSPGVVTRSLAASAARRKKSGASVLTAPPDLPKNAPKPGDFQAY